LQSFVSWRRDSEVGKYVLVLKKVNGSWLIAVASATPGAQ
jgi:hypothetical protein